MPPARDDLGRGHFSEGLFLQPTISVKPDDKPVVGHPGPPPSWLSVGQFEAPLNARQPLRRVR
jgi:hypothetical protein